MKHLDIFEYDYEYVPREGLLDLKIQITAVLKSHKFSMANALIKLPDGSTRPLEVYGVDGGIETGDVGGGMFAQKALPRHMQGLQPGTGFIVREVTESQATLEAVLEFINHWIHTDQRLEQDRRTERYVNRMLDELTTLNAFLRNGRKPYSLTIGTSARLALLDSLVAANGAMTSIEMAGETLSAVVWLREEVAEMFRTSLDDVIDFTPG